MAPRALTDSPASFRSVPDRQRPVSAVSGFENASDARNVGYEKR
ncbi:hypothetical protein NJ7G_2650 [Natrinema sp. J7-2]|nr:hypothetical protein NJ7G_2650 [Natrinema sp. J7-2]